MSRPVYQQPYQQGQPQGQLQAPSSVQAVFFSDKNYQTLETVLAQDFQTRHGAPLSDQQSNRLQKTLQHYMQQVYDKQGNKLPVVSLNKEVLGACAKDFSQFMQRKEMTKGTNSVKQVMDDSLFMETSQRFEKIASERNEIKALPPSVPDFRISLSEDGPPAAEMFERAKKFREMEALRSAQAADLSKAEAGVQNRVMADNQFQALQDERNRNNEMTLALRTKSATESKPIMDQSLVVLPDRRELLMGSIGSFDSMQNSNHASGNATLSLPMLMDPFKKADLPQQNIIRHENVISYREVENNLFIYSADRDWLKNTKENRYQFTVNFDPAANSQGFGPSLAAQQKFKNIVRIELVKATLPGESLSVTVNHGNTTDTSYQDNILNLPYVSLRIAELENNNYGTDNYIDRSFGVLQYDNKWISDKTVQANHSNGYLNMTPKYLKCQKEYYPTPLSTLQKMTLELRRPNGELVSTAVDTFDIVGIIAPQSGNTAGVTFPFTMPITYGITTGTVYNVMVNNDPANFYINTSKFFSKFEVSNGDRIQISGYNYNEDALNDATYGQSLRAFCQWINRPEGHVVLGAAYSPNTYSILDGFNAVGYANYLVIPTRYQDPTTGATNPLSFGTAFGATLNAFGAALQSPMRLMNLNKQTSFVFRIITREMDSLPSLRPDNNY